VWDDSLADDAVAAHVEELTAWLASALPADAVVADLGCGTGNHSAALRALGARVVGVDIAPGMLARARAKTTGDDRVPALVRADLQRRLPLATGSVDAALSVYSTQFLDLPPFLAEVHRVLRPGGAFLVEVPHTTQASRPRRATVRLRLFDSVKGVAAGLGRRVGMVHLRAPSEVRDALTTAGFLMADDRSFARSYAVLAHLV
jgi:SAM-dependent methyltransferase